MRYPSFVPIEVQKFLNKPYVIELPGDAILVFNSLQIGLIIFLIFLLILTFGSLRHRYSHWTMGGFTYGILFGVLATILIQGILLVGGTRLFIGLLKWDEAPKPIVEVMNSSRNTALKVLGAQSQDGEKPQEKPTIGRVMEQYKKLSSDESESVRSLICAP